MLIYPGGHLRGYPLVVRQTSTGGPSRLEGNIIGPLVICRTSRRMSGEPPVDIRQCNCTLKQNSVLKHVSTAQLNI
jgi:hypothetical protein